jgi:hypothetical protein
MALRASPAMTESIARLRRIVLVLLLVLASIALNPAQAQQSSQALDLGRGAGDLLLLRDGTNKRGHLSGCDRETCRLGAEVVPRAQIEWIGLARESPTPPPVRDPTRDEMHLIDHSVQMGMLTGIDSSQVYSTTIGTRFTATSSLRRERVAWIHLGRSTRADHSPPRNAESKRKETRRDERSTSNHAQPWRVPPRIFIWIPRQCPTCLATLHVLELEARDDAVFLTRDRVVSVSDSLLTGTWFSYDPPLRLFPGTIATEHFSQDSRALTWLTLDHYLENRGGGAGGGSRAPGAPAGLPSGSRGRTTGPIDQILGDPVGRLREGIEDWARDRIAREREAENARGGAGTSGARQAGGRGRTQYLQQAGVVDYTQTLRMRNWQVAADDHIRRRAPDWERYRRLKDIPLYDVEVDLRFNWRDYVARGREVDEDGYTTDTASGQTRRAGPAQPAQDVNAPIPAGPQSAPPTGPLDRWLGNRVQRLRDLAEEWVRERLAEDAARGGASRSRSAGRVGPTAGLGSHAVHLAMRWFRADGRVTPHYLADVIRNVLEGQSEVMGFTISATLPDGALDMEKPPSWPASNPRPPARAPEFNWRP